MFFDDFPLLGIESKNGLDGFFDFLGPLVLKIEGAFKNFRKGALSNIL